MRFILIILLGPCLLSSCQRGEESLSGIDADSKEETLRSMIGEKDRSIQSLEIESKRLIREKEILASIHQESISLITTRIGELEAEITSAKEVLEDIRAGCEQLDKMAADLQLQIERGEKVVVPMCANGPWDDWPKMAEDADEIILSNVAAAAELRKILKVLSHPAMDEKPNRQGDGSLKNEPGTRPR